MTTNAPAYKWEKPVDDARLQKAAEALKAHGVNAIIVNTRAEAKAKVLEILPQGAEVYTTTSATLDEVGLTPELNESGQFDSVRKRVAAIDQAERRRATRRAAAVAQYVIGSVHAVTEDGRVVIASASGSQIAPYAYGAENVIWVVGAQKVVKDLTEAFQRVEQQSFPMEDARMKRVAGPQAASSINKLMVLNKENVPNRITMVLVKERVGF